MRDAARASLFGPLVLALVVTGSAQAVPGPPAFAVGGAAGLHLVMEAVPKPRREREPATRAEWQAAVQKAIASRKLYPGILRRLRAAGYTTSGSTVVGFTIDREGRLTMLEVSRSSGVPEVDEAALDMVRRAAPLPKPPPDLPGATVKLSLPVSFRD